MPQKLRCEVARVLDHGEGVYSIFLKPEAPAPRFEAGQFLHLALDEYRHGDFWPDSRPFSIASSPANRQLLRITYAAKGKFSGRMEAELQTGRTVWVKMPYGDFKIDPHGDACLLAGGTGVTAFTAFLAGLPADYPHSIHLFYGARHPGLLIYRQLVEEAARQCPNLHVHLLAEQEAADAGCLAGRIDTDILWKIVPDPLSQIYYLSGPPQMLQGLRQELAGCGVEADRIAIDAWE